MSRQVPNNLECIKNISTEFETFTSAKFQVSSEVLNKFFIKVQH